MRNQEGFFQIFDVPAGIGYNNISMLPILIK
jgi:hypothetical protein